MPSNTNCNSRKYSDPFSKIYISNCSCYFANLLLLYGSVSSLLFDIYGLLWSKNPSFRGTQRRFPPKYIKNTLGYPF